jgi:Na+/H+ antiporter NhaD/arsenite permease-like protein
VAFDNSRTLYRGIELLWETNDFSIYLSLALLFGIAAQFRAMDGYSFLRSLISIFERKLGALYAVVVVTSIFSPIILNDVVILILTPVIVRYAKKSNVDIAPLLVAEICFTNITSSLTPFGNPQNLLMWQASGISASRFVLGTWLPLAVSAVLTAAALYHFRRKEGGVKEFSAPILTRPPLIYLIAVALAVFILPTLGFADVLTLGVAFVLGFSFTFRSPGRLVKEFDYRGLLILCLLIGAITLIASLVRPILVQFVSPAVAGNQPYSALFVGLTSNLISNVPTTQLMLGTVAISQRAAPMLAVEAGLAGNITPIASFANILALLMVRRGGLPIRKAILLQVVVGLISFLPALL